MRPVCGVLETLADKSILALVLYSIIFSVANGSAEALWVYVQSYYWEFSSEQIAWMVSAQLLAPLFAFVLTPVFSNRRDKKIVLIWSSVASVVGYGWPLLLRSLGLFMSNDNPLLFPLMLVNAAVVTIFDIIVYTVGYSMMADVVEARQLETGPAGKKGFSPRFSSSPRRRSAVWESSLADSFSS